MKNKLPIYDITLDELNLSQGVGYISLVDEPAIMVDWVKLAKESQMSFKASVDKQLLYGPFLIPDMLIYRHDDRLGEYYVRFKAEEIQKIYDKFNLDSNNNNINFQHSDVRVDARVSSNWIIEGIDKSQNFGFDLPDGTWFGAVKVNDSSFWNDKVKKDEVKGFSVEILADLQLELKKNNIQMEEITNPVVEAVVEVVEETILAVDPNAPATPAPADNKPLTADDVSQMIDARFAELMTEISSIKDAIAPLIDNAAVNASDTATLASVEEKVKAIEEKLSATPGAVSVTSRVVTPLTIENDKFAKDIERLRTFAKIK